MDKSTIPVSSPRWNKYSFEHKTLSFKYRFIYHSLYEKKTRISGKIISEILTINGIRFILENGSWGLVRASSNKPSLVVVIESVESMNEMKNIFNFVDVLLQTTGKIGTYDQKI